MRNRAMIVASMVAAAGCGRERLRLRAGESCAPESACEAGTTCFAAKCRPTEGGACDEERLRCVPGMLCENGRCVAVNEPPTLSFVRPPELAAVRRNVTVEVDAQDPDGVGEVRLTAAGGSPFATAQASPYEGQLDTTGFPDGELGIEAQADDTKGLTSRRTRTLVVDNTPPALSNLFAEPSPAHWGELVTITFTASEALAAARVNVAGGAATAGSQDGLDYSFTYRVGRDAPSPSTLHAEGDDAAGNTGSADGSLDIIASCAPDYDDCDTDPDTVCETPLDTASNCAECGHTCTEAPDDADPSCASGQCAFQCRTGFHRCDAGCESNTDPLHCGADCKACPVPDKGTAICSNGECGISCDNDYHPCFIRNADVCASNLSADTCGSRCLPCSAPSNADATCDAGSCGFACKTGYCKVGPNCVDNQTDGANCGACGHACAPTQTCVAGACTPPVLEAEVVFGGSGDQEATGVVVAGGAVFISGIGAAVTAGSQFSGNKYAFVTRFNLSSSGSLSQAWSHAWPDVPAGGDWFYGITAGANAVYVVGQSTTQTSAGGTIALKYPFAGQFPTWYSWWSLGSTYNQRLHAATALSEGGQTYLYAAGEVSASGGGAVIIKAKDPGTTGSEQGATGTEDYAPMQPGWPKLFTALNGYGYGIAALNGLIYAAGAAPDGYPILLKYDTSGAQQWSKSGSQNFASAGQFLGVAAHGGALYAVGRTLTSGDKCLADKWTEQGTHAWTQLRLYYGPGAKGCFEARGVVGLGNRIYAVGYAYDSAGTNGYDAILLEIDPQAGTLRSSTLYGGDGYQFANAVATDGSSLFVVGETDSDTTSYGNSEAFILRYRP